MWRNARKAVLASILITLFPVYLTPQEAYLFEYKHNTGDQWHLTSIVQEKVSIGKQILYKTEILNKISVEVLQGDGRDGRIWNRYEIAEKKNGSNVYAWNESFDVEYYRDRRGRIAGLPKTSLVPTVRNVPVYPPKPVNRGDRWTERGSEIFYLEPTYGINERLEIHFVANYLYWGRKKSGERELDVIFVDYSYSWKPAPLTLKRLQRYETHPVMIHGKFHQELFWDSAAGRNYAEEGEFNYKYTMNNGDVFTFQGTTKGQAVYPEVLNRTDLLREIDELDENGIQAEINERGVSLVLNNIHFFPDSAKILPGEENNLDKILDLLSRHSERDIMIVGHTAGILKRGDGQLLSEERAKVVADIILEAGVREPSQMIIRGMGNSEPVADNATESGRRKNRRVEIIILEN